MQSSTVRQTCTSTFLSYLREFFNNTSVHGLKYLTESRRPWPERLLWFLCISLSLGLCVTFIGQTWTRWRKSPVIVAMDETQRPIWEVPFPAITICPETKIRKSMLDINDLLTRKRNRSEIPQEEQQILYELSVQCDLQMLYHRNLTRRKNDLIDLMENYSLPIRNVMQGSMFRQKYHSRRAFQPILTDEGLCFSFNMLPALKMFPKDTFHGSRNYLQYEQNASWTVSGYDEGSGRDAYPYRVLMSGQPMGFSAYLKTDEKDFDFLCKVLEEGYKVQLHSPAEFPRPAHQSFRVPLNSAVHVTITPSEIRTDHDLKERYDVQQRKCFFPEERQLRFFLQYTQQNCELECITNFTLKHCGCVEFHMPRTVDTVICGPKARRCISIAAQKFQAMVSGLERTEEQEPDSFKEYEEIEDDEEEEGNNDEFQDDIKCNCLQSCNHIRYETERSHADLDIDRFRKMFPDFDEEKAFVSKVSISSKESYFIPTRRMELYGRLAFLANCGGLLGLCLGMSVLSVLEVLYWSLVRPFCRRNTATITDKDHVV